MKKLLIAALVVVLALCGCGEQPSANVMNEWEKQANLSAEETADELYQKALNEGVLTIYTVTSRIMDVADSFKAQYPGLQVEVIYTRAEELFEKLTDNSSSEKDNIDLIFCNNADGSLTEKLIPNGIIYKYLPWDIKDYMRKGDNEPYLSVFLEVPLFAYNSSQYNTPPVTNWWELTEPQWKDKVYITNPLRSMISYILFSTMLKEDELMAGAYQQRYGKAFEEADGEGAGKTFLRKLVENGLHVVNDSDDVADAIAKPGGGTTNAVGILNASKLRLCDRGYPLAVSYETAPFAGVIYPTGIMMVGGAENISSAKLFVRWVLGEADGSGEGYKPFLTEGAWPARTDVSSPSKPLDSFNAIYADEQYAAESRASFIKLWQSIMP